MSIKLSAQGADPFALYHAPLAAARLWRRVSFGLAGIATLLAVALCVTSMQPPTVVVYDRQDAASLRVVSQRSVPPATAADARLFFVHMLGLRYGWDSFTVKRDLERYLAACFGPVRKSEQRFFAAAVATASDSKEKTRLASYIESGVAHALLLPQDLRQVDCRRRAERQQWDCYVQADIETTRLLSSAALSSPAVRQRLQFVGSLLEAPRTASTPYGLVLAALHSEEAHVPARGPMPDIAYDAPTRPPEGPAAAGGLRHGESLP